MSDDRRPFWSYYSLENFSRIKPIEWVLKESERAFAEDENERLLEAQAINDGSAPHAAQAAAMSEHPRHLQKRLGAMDLIFYGVGSTVGAGIYSLIGPGLQKAGPALLFSFLIGAISCVFTGMAYSEFAARIPVAGSAYTYAYTSFGEMLGWLIGWNLTLEYAIGAAAVARSWSSYFATMFTTFGADFPVWLNAWDIGFTTASPLAAVIIAICTVIMLMGAKDSAKFNNIVTVTNVCVLIFVCIAGATKMKGSNLTCVNDSFAPYGGSKVFSGAGTVFFSYLGFDMVSSMAEEVVKPQRDLPLGIIGSLVVAGSIYMAVTLVVSGMVCFTEIDNLSGNKAPLTEAFSLVGMHWATYIINIGAVFGLTASTFTGLMGQPRIFYRMSVDGLLFPLFSKLSSRSVPIVGSILTGIITALIAFFIGLEALADAISIGTLFAFSVVDAGVIVQRRKDPTSSKRVVLAVAIFIVASFIACMAFQNDWNVGVTVVFGIFAGGSLVYMHFLPVNDIESSFKCPLVPLIPCAGIAINMSMMVGLSGAAWLRLALWTLLGVALYLFYGVQHSVLNKFRPSSIISDMFDEALTPNDSKLM